MLDEISDRNQRSVYRVTEEIEGGIRMNSSGWIRGMMAKTYENEAFCCMSGRESRGNSKNGMKTSL